MENISLNLAKPHMVLAKDIMRPNTSNQVPISRKGTKLTETLIKRLLDIGIQSLVVEEHPVCKKEENGLQEDLDKLEYRFKRLEGNRRMMKIKEIYKKLLIRSEKGEYERETDSVS